jgi:hypothetical protein
MFSIIAVPRRPLDWPYNARHDYQKIPPDLPLPKGGILSLFGKEGPGEISRQTMQAISD